MPYMENHTLYYKKQCPFCQKVLRFMDDNKITMDARHLATGNQNDLVRIGESRSPASSSTTKPSTNQTTSSPYLRSTNA
ncbi:MAG: glutaredoxin domain-containing protein [Eggerthella lenta]